MPIDRSPISVHNLMPLVLRVIFYLHYSFTNNGSNTNSNNVRRESQKVYTVLILTITSPNFDQISYIFAKMKLTCTNVKISTSPPGGSVINYQI